ncbi:glycosyltransferase [Desulfovibrio legallii]|uniref:Glycosyltransferase, GT2 family n=1 Tax=Desulfovibrio legallii TaxID=571438 RepID=A0A1G7NPF4_9BACT|nr:glycosyltransferase [Desulfovibrio legallii]SDF75160.1 Glycosyltransferase, GT2 family [Desulfovibrio legallii]
MNNNYFKLLREGLSAELAILNLEEKLRYMRMYQDLVVPDANMAAAFVNALIADADLPRSAEAQQAFFYFLQMAWQHQPLHRSILQALQNLRPTPQRQEHLAMLEKLDLSDAQWSQMQQCGAPEEGSAPLLALLRANPAHVGAANALLALEEKFPGSIEDWSSLFRCPHRMQSLWDYRLFLHYAALGRHAAATEAWARLQGEYKLPLACQMAADNFALAGATDMALALYARACAADPRLRPVARRMETLRHPPQAQEALVHQCRTAICLYSWNKGAVLEATLRSLAASETADNPVFVLLNGCTDGSAQRIEGLRDLFAGRSFTVITLPINIGAPAARNWLLHLPDVRACPYVAFMDDDVTVPANWLVRYLTVMEEDARTAVVGGKAVFPKEDGLAPGIQYFYRLVSLAKDGLLKLSVATPGQNVRDTGLYSFSRPCMNVMGCLHLLRTAALREVGDFDIRYTPSQVDDLDHDLSTCLAGYQIMYCGDVTCEHHQNSGVGVKRRPGLAQMGSIIGNDLKMTYKFAEKQSELLRISQELSTLPLPGAPTP